ncbi:cupin domain-containing protein [Sphingomonas antarctica]
MVTRAIGATHFINGITRFDPGASVPLHFHNCDESVTLLSGEAIAEIAGRDHPVSLYDTTFIPAGVHHRFINASSSESMTIMWIYASVDADRTIVATGETRRIDEEHSLIGQLR